MFLKKDDKSVCRQLAVTEGLNYETARGKHFMLDLSTITSRPLQLLLCLTHLFPARQTCQLFSGHLAQNPEWQLVDWRS